MCALFIAASTEYTVATTTKYTQFHAKCEVQAFPSKDQLQLVEAQVAEWDASLPVEEACTPPASWYTNPSMLHKEAATVFANNWLAVGR